MSATPELWGYAFFAAAGAAIALWVKRREDRRLGYVATRAYRFLAVAELAGAVIGAKVGMLLYVPPEKVGGIVGAMSSLRFDGKTILGAIAGGYLFGEIGKRLLGIRFSTGDALALALPLGQAAGRLGCFVGGCCYGAPAELPWSVQAHGAWRHPLPLYEAALLVVLAIVLALARARPLPAGHLFRWYLAGYAVIRIVLDGLRGEPQPMLGPLSFAQVFCLVALTVLLVSLAGGRASTAADRTAAPAR